MDWSMKKKNSPGHYFLRPAALASQRMCNIRRARLLAYYHTYCPGLSFLRLYFSPGLLFSTFPCVAHTYCAAAATVSVGVFDFANLVYRPKITRALHLPRRDSKGQTAIGSLFEMRKRGIFFD